MAWNAREPISQRWRDYNWLGVRGGFTGTGLGRVSIKISLCSFFFKGLFIRTIHLNAHFPISPAPCVGQGQSFLLYIACIYHRAHMYWILSKECWKGVFMVNFLSWEHSPERKEGRITWEQVGYGYKFKFPQNFPNSKTDKETRRNLNDLAEGHNKVQMMQRNILLTLF